MPLFEQKNFFWFLIGKPYVRFSVFQCGQVTLNSVFRVTGSLFFWLTSWILTGNSVSVSVKTLIRQQNWPFTHLKKRFFSVRNSVLVKIRQGLSILSNDCGIVCDIPILKTEKNPSQGLKDALFVPKSTWNSKTHIFKPAKNSIVVAVFFCLRFIVAFWNFSSSTINITWSLHHD